MSASTPTSPSPASSFLASPRRGGPTTAMWLLGRLAVAAVVGLAVGATCEWLVLRVPHAVVPVTNSAAPWLLAAFVVALLAGSVGESVALAIVALVACVLGFYVAEELRGWAVSSHQVAFWSVSALVAGPLVGLAAGWLRHAGRTSAALGAGGLAGMLIGEAVHGLTTLRLTTPAPYWHWQLVVGVALAIGVPVTRRRRGGRGVVAGALVVSALAAAVVTLATVSAYHVQ